MTGGAPNVVVAAGTTESRRLVALLLERGYRVLASQGTDLAMDWPVHPRLRVRAGALDAFGWASLLREERAAAAVDASHPFAVALRAELERACTVAKVPLLRLERKCVEPPPGSRVFPDAQALGEAVLLPGERVLLTTGSRTLALYHRLALDRGCELRARLCPGSVAEQALAESGFPPEHVVWGRGRLTVDDWRGLLRSIGATTLATKESGEEGGVLEKFEACRLEGVRMAIVRRPIVAEGAHGDPESLASVLAVRLGWTSS